MSLKLRKFTRRFAEISHLDSNIFLKFIKNINYKIFNYKETNSILKITED